MKIQELRIGNYIQKNGLNATVEIINGEVNEIYYLGDDFYYSDSIDDLRATTLNEEWLLKFGFKQVRSLLTKRYESKCEKVLIYIMPETGVFANGVVNDIRLQYVHQLQNLYFALTGAELTYENETK